MLEVLAILTGGTKCFHPLKVGHEKIYTFLRVVRKVSDRAMFLILLPPPPHI